MPSQQNIDLLKDTADKIAKSKNVVLVEYQGLSVKDQVTLRANIKKAGGELNVTKNRLVKLALKDRLKDIPEALDSALNGPSAIVFGYDDAVAATKAIMDFAKDHETLKAKVGVLMADSAETTDKVLSAEEVEALSKLPGRQELLTMLVIQLASPVQGFYNVLKGNLSGLARVLNGIKEQKEKSN
jgi:large subunit ribosomal protein L10